MSTEFRDAPEVEEIARRLIPQFHSHLVEARIVYASRYGNWTSKGRAVLGMASKCSPWDRYALRDPDDPDDPGPDFRILINGDAWQTLTPEQRTALVDHELSHCTRGADDDDGNPTWQIAGHDVEEFAAIIDRHGLWQQSLEQFGKAAAPHIQQLRFDTAADELKRLYAADAKFNGEVVVGVDLAGKAEVAAAGGDDDTTVTITDCQTGRSVVTTGEGLRRAADELATRRGAAGPGY